jgi:hypothetical protein
MLTTLDIVVAVLAALVIRDLVIVALDWLANTLAQRRFVKELDEVIEEYEYNRARERHPATRKRAVKKTTKRK